MKIICDCGNKEEFNTVDREIGEQTSITEDEGQYAAIDNFRFWEANDQVGIVCEKCGKSIWLFT